ncbi:MAG: hypothetical protein HOO67_03075, partial [Candidatus Peribacteraceae bacterium]|nr:hypothetical protein [Candidatus Peribacteraceae bacterium]
MRFEYVPYGGNWMPLIPVAFAHGKNRLPVVGALVDTGASHSLLPMEMAVPLGISVDVADQMETQVAGGGQCFIYPSPTKIEYVLQDPVSGREHSWNGNVFFALGQKFVLLGHHQCLEKFDVMFRGKERVLEIE